MAASMKKPMLLVAPDEFEFHDVELNKPLTEYLSLTNTMDVPMPVSMRSVCVCVLCTSDAVVGCANRLAALALCLVGVHGMHQ
jgi:hypothetical protein